MYSLSGGISVQECYVLFQSVSDIRDFVSLATKQRFEIRVEQGNLSTSATSIMSVFCMGLNRPVRVLIADAQADTAAFFRALQVFAPCES